MPDIEEGLLKPGTAAPDCTVPMTYVIGRDGKVVDAWYGYEEARARKAIKNLGL